MKSELDELTEAVDAWEVDITRPESDATIRLIDAARAYVQSAKREVPAVSLLELIEEIETQFTRDENFYTSYGGDPKTRKGNLTCYLPYELLRKTLRS